MSGRWICAITVALMIGTGVATAQDAQMSQDAYRQCQADRQAMAEKEAKISQHLADLLTRFCPDSVKAAGGKDIEDFLAACEEEIAKTAL